MTGTTTPDGLRYPNDYEQPADSPSAFQMLANDVQAALLQRMHVTPVAVAYSLSSGWAADVSGFGTPGIYKSGRVCMSKGLAVRTTDLSVTDNTPIQVATVPAGHRPQQSVRVSCVWYGANTTPANNVDNGILTIWADGVVHFTSTYNATIKIGQWLSFAGFSWVTV